MSTLYLKLPDFHEETGAYVLRCADTKATANELAAGHFRPSVTSTIQENEHSSVYRADLGNERIVLKICYGGRNVYDLTKEAKVYTELLAKESLKDVVPRFYGFFTGEDEDGSEIGCIVLEDCGKSIDTDFDGVDDDGAFEILRLLAKIHKEAGELLDFAERNVVHRDGRYRLIDFHDFRRHDCKFNGDWRAGELVPGRVEFGCDVLWFWGKEFGIWAEYKTPVVCIAGYKVMDTGAYPPQEVINALLPENAEIICRMSTNVKRLARWIVDAKTKGIVDINDVDRIEEHKKLMPELNTRYHIVCQSDFS